MLSSDFESIEKLKEEVNIAKILFQSASTQRKNEALENMIKELEKNRKKILKANELDLKSAKQLLDAGKITKSAF